MARRQEYTYNEHDVSQVREIYRQRRRRRRKLRIRRLMVVFVIGLIGYYFYSDYSRIQVVNVNGTKHLDANVVRNMIDVKEHQSYTLFTFKNSIKSDLEKQPLIDNVTVSKTLLGKIDVTIKESAILAYGVIDDNIYVIDIKGRVARLDNSEKKFVVSATKMHGFNLKRFKKIASEYAKLPSLVTNQVSDVEYAPKKADTSRCKFSMDDGKILYLRIEDMAKQLSGDNYQSLVLDYPKYKYFDFMGKYCYRYK